MFNERKKDVSNLTNRALFVIIMGSIGLASGIFAMSPYNELGPYAHFIGGGLPFALLLCGLGVLFILLGLWHIPLRRSGLKIR